MRYVGTDPMPFPGTADDYDANLLTHDWPRVDGYLVPGGRCRKCDVRPEYVSARWPCGTEVPRVEVFS